MPRTYPTPDVDGLLAAWKSAPGKRARNAVERALAKAPDAEVVPGLIAALRDAADQSAFSAAARLLAARGGEEAVAELARHARENRRFPRLAIRALSRCEHPGKIQPLVELMLTGRKKLRRAAVAALGRVNEVQVIEPLCNTARSGPAEFRPVALQALQKMGRPGKLALRALRERALSDAACARTILGLEVMHVYVFPLSFTTFDAERFLSRAARGQTAWRERAQAVLDRVIEQRTLLRAVAPASGDHLLRASSSANHSRPDELLRAVTSLATDDTERRPWWKRLLRSR